MLIIMYLLDATDRRILAALDADSRATVQAIAYELGLARGTVHTRLDRLQRSGALKAHSPRLHPPALGWPLRAHITAEANQDKLDLTIADLEQIPEIIECVAVSGQSDLSIEIVARDADDVYRITQAIMKCRGVLRTATSIMLRELISRRQHQLL
ncbi:Lrp/AsnC family transcriptional regulator [Leucobacter sp. G161]|uniref:Lrp/AsnC family transcriptional regulator n=1 Tax=Leucobacter sp. G161 TaxID=663704 RepID=UPI00073CB68B|nr:AsnC family transcriptional regulator [Leucobacter sp. G161]KUF07939.1 AsnC family transcriptional regulator [Leucobacter sp. G161]